MVATDTTRSFSKTVFREIAENRLREIFSIISWRCHNFWLIVTCVQWLSECSGWLSLSEINQKLWQRLSFPEDECKGNSRGFIHNEIAHALWIMWKTLVPLIKYGGKPNGKRCLLWPFSLFIESIVILWHLQNTKSIYVYQVFCIHKIYLRR